MRVHSRFTTSYFPPMLAQGGSTPSYFPPMLTQSGFATSYFPPMLVQGGFTMSYFPPMLAQGGSTSSFNQLLKSGFTLLDTHGLTSTVLHKEDSDSLTSQSTEATNLQVYLSLCGRQTPSMFFMFHEDMFVQRAGLGPFQQCHLNVL